MAPSHQMSIERADAKDLEKSQQAAADARKDMQVALQMWGRDNEKSREVYKTKVKERLKIMEKEVESSVRSIVKRLDQEKAFRGRKVRSKCRYKASLVLSTF